MSENGFEKFNLGRWDFHVTVEKGYTVENLAGGLKN